MNQDLESLSKPELAAHFQALLEKQKQVLKAEYQKQLEGKDQELAKLKKQEAAIKQLHIQLEDKDQELAQLKSQIQQLLQKLFGQKRERFTDPETLQLPLFASPETQAQEEEEVKEIITYERRKSQNAGKKAHPGRVKLPDHLRIEKVELHPEGDLSEMVCIGQEVTEELAYQPEEFFITHYIRYKYAPKSKEGAFKIAPLPERMIDKGLPSFRLVAMLLVNKYVDHLPLYRQRKRFARAGIEISPSTLDHWVKRGGERLTILYEALRNQIRQKGYLQADESPLKVLDKDKKGSTHQGYYWFYNDPLDDVVFIEYYPGRSKKAAQKMLSNFVGYLQSDGYSVYKSYAKDNPHMVPLMCWAHVRRKFFEAQGNDPQKSREALRLIQQLYAVEQKAREEGMSPEQRFQLRLAQSSPILNQIKAWLNRQAPGSKPKSALGKATFYALNHWDQLRHYLLDGHLEIDNNRVENAVRPLALGRKNYLFAGSHEAAQRAAAIYTFMAICQRHQVNPLEWLSYIFEHLMNTSVQKLPDLFPQNFHKIQQKKA